MVRAQHPDGDAKDDEPSDQELIMAAKEGGESGFSAFEILVTRYRDRVYRLAIAMTKSETEAEEVVQESFLSVFRNLDNFRGESTPSTWIYRVTTNAALMRLRRERRKPLRSLDGMESKARPKGPVWPSGTWSRQPDEAVLNRELRHHIQQAIRELPEKYGVVLLLRDVEGLSNAEVAETIGLTVPTVKARLHRARFFLRKQLQRYFRG